MTAFAHHAGHACPDILARLRAVVERGGIVFETRAADAESRDAAHELSAMSDTDAEDIRLARSGDGHAFERIVRRYQQEIAKRLSKFARNQPDLEALVQETFVQAFLSLNGYRGDAPLVHWLHRIGVRVGYRWWRTQRARPIHVELDAAALSSHSRPDTFELHDVLERVSSRDRLVLTLLYLEDRSVDETAALTGWSRSMVKVQAFRARARLRRLMQDLPPGEIP